MKETKFKQTEFGIIPGDWEECTLRELIDVLTDFTANGSFESLAQNVKYLEKPSYARLIRLTDIRTNFANDGIYVSKESYNFLKKSYLEGGELLLANVGAYAGYSFIYPKNLSFRGTLGPNMFLIKFFNQKIDNMFAYYAFSHGIVFNQLVSKAASSAQPKLNKEDVRTCFVHIPSSLTEQKNIAQTLSDVDAVISTTEKLIAKKKNIKQGAMQQLLTGKKRLPGFAPAKPTYKQTELGKIPTDWEFEVFGKLVSIYRGGSPRPIEAFITTNPSGINWIKIGDVDEGAKYITSTQERIIPEGKSRSREVHKGDFILSNSMSFGRPYILKVDGCIHDGWLTIQDYQDTFDTDFLYYMLSSEVVFNQYVSMAAGSSVQNLNKEKVAAVKLFYPPSKTEQTAIANVLSDMDTEISALETKLAKYRKLKTGMMQQLLTGKIRLV